MRQRSFPQMPDNYFRIKLVCTLLDCCGRFFRSGRNRAELDEFLVYFQFYILSKNQPMPVDTDIAVCDTLELLRPKLALFETIEDAAVAVQKLEKAKAEKLAKQLVRSSPFSSTSTE